MTRNGGLGALLEREGEWNLEVKPRAPGIPLPFPYAGYRAFSHDVTAAVLVFQNNETAAIFVFQTNPVGVELFIV